MDCCAQVLKSYTSEVSLQQHTIDDETVRRSDCRRYLEYTPCVYSFASELNSAVVCARDSGRRRRAVKSRLA